MKGGKKGKKGEGKTPFGKKKARETTRLPGGIGKGKEEGGLPQNK